MELKELEKEVQTLLRNGRIEVVYWEEHKYLFICLDWINPIEVDLNQDEIKLTEKPLITKRYCTSALDLHIEAINIFKRLNNEHVRNKLIDLIKEFKK